MSCAPSNPSPTVIFELPTVKCHLQQVIRLKLISCHCHVILSVTRHWYWKRFDLAPRMKPSAALASTEDDQTSEQRQTRAAFEF